MFNVSQQLLNRTVLDTIEKQASAIHFSANPWTSSREGSSEDSSQIPHCEYVLYLQLHPVPSLSNDSPTSSHPGVDLLAPIEHELRFPTGHHPYTPPPLILSMVAFSPDCGFIIESKGQPDYALEHGNHLKGPKIEVLLTSSRHAALAFALVLSGQIYFMLNQIKDASTPSTRSRISFYTIATLSMGDGLALTTCLALGSFMESTALILFSIAFLAFMGVTFFDLKFLMAIWTVQLEERRRQERQQPTSSNTNTPPGTTPATPAPMPIITAAGADTLPLPVSARQAISSGATPIILPPDQDDDENGTNNNNGTTTVSVAAQAMALYPRFYFVLLGIGFLSLHATSWTTTYRSAYFNLLAFLYLSFWVPQIYRNVMRNCRKALLWEFVAGQSILRILPLAYFYVIPDNVRFIENDINAMLILAGWVWSQICVLVFQDLLGPRFFIKEAWAPPTYDYHRILREDEESSTLPIGFGQGSESAEITSPSTSRGVEAQESKGKRTFDCVICMQPIEVQVVPAGASANAAVSGLGGTMARRTYMITPCRHIFHTPCLEGAMRYKLQCPICRETLPPL